MVYSIPVRSVISTSNNSTTSLTTGTSQLFTGTAEDVTEYSRVGVFVLFASGTPTLQAELSLQFSVDGTNWDVAYTTIVSESQNVVWTHDVAAQFCRVVLTGEANATSGDQTSLRLETRFVEVPGGNGDGVIDAYNSRGVASQIAGSGSFVGKYVDTTAYSRFTCLLGKASADTVTLNIRFSTDGTSADRTRSIVYGANNTGGAHSVLIVSKYMSVEVVNDSGSATTGFFVQTKFHKSQSGGATSSLAQVLSIRDDVAVVRDPTIPALDTARELISGRSALSFFGFLDTVDSTWRDVHRLGATTPNYPWPSYADIGVLTVSTDSADDSGLSTAVLTLAANPTDGETFTIGSRTYTLQATLTNVDGNIHIHTTAAGTVLNVVDAIGLGSAGEGSGAGYAAAMTLNTDFSAADGTGDSVDFTTKLAAVQAYADANDGDIEVLATTETGAQMSFASTTAVQSAGCQSISIKGLGAGGAFTTEYVVLKGLDVSPALTTANTYVRVNYTRCQTVGTRGGGTSGRSRSPPPAATSSLKSERSPARRPGSSREVGRPPSRCTRYHSARSRTSPQLTLKLTGLSRATSTCGKMRGRTGRPGPFDRGPFCGERSGLRARPPSL